jgi:NADP-dependent 3-hydroxy acid dehydrogenase YdfG
MKILAIIAGAAGEIGTTFCHFFANQQIDCIAVIRHKKLAIRSSYIQSIPCNLDIQKDIEEKFSAIRFENYDQVIYLHTIGVDKFNPRGYPAVHKMETIDPDVYNTNVNSFKYLMRFLVGKIESINKERTEKTTLKISCIAGVADKHAPFVIESFCEAKYIVKQYIQSQCSIHPTWISGLSINVTSTITKSALAVRPHADTTYWFLPEEIVKESFDVLLKRVVGYSEIDLIKKSPNFVDGYYENNHLLYEKWSRETGIQ